MEILRFKIFAPFEEVNCALSTRHGGFSDVPWNSLNLGFDLGDIDENVHRNYEKFCSEVDVALDELCWGVQEHTDMVFVMNEALGFDKPMEVSDGFISSEPGVALSVRFADCQGVFMYDPEKNVVAAVHSGWRGNTKNIVGKTVRKMIKEMDCSAEDILVGIGPSLGPCCAEFSDPESELPEFMQKYVDEKRRVDLWKCSMDQLMAEGVNAKNIENMRICTSCNTDKFFSYRAEKPVTGRMCGVIELKEAA